MQPVLALRMWNSNSFDISDSTGKRLNYMLQDVLIS